MPPLPEQDVRESTPNSTACSDRTRSSRILSSLGCAASARRSCSRPSSPRPSAKGWLWASADLSESASISETALAQRLLADLALVSSSATVVEPGSGQGGRLRSATWAKRGPTARTKYSLASTSDTPGLVADKIKATLEFAWQHLRRAGAAQGDLRL